MRERQQMLQQWKLKGDKLKGWKKKKRAKKTHDVPGVDLETMTLSTPGTQDGVR